MNMRIGGRVALVLATVLFASSVPFVSAASAQVKSDSVPEHVANQALVGAKPGGKSQARQAIENNGGRVVEYNADGNFFVVKTPGAATDFVNRLGNNRSVRYAELDYILRADATPNDPRYGELYGMQKISAPAAWDINKGSTGVVVGVIDTGVDYTHEDLAANMWQNASGHYGYDCRNNDTDPMDDHGHGTHASGTIGAVGNNGKGVVGVNWTVKIMALKFLSRSGSGSTSDAVECLYWARDNGADLTSNSWGGGGFSQSLYDAIAASRTADMLFVAAAGNDGVNTDTTPHYPSSYDLDNVISVAATDSSDNITSWSNYGLKSVDLGAPGASILSTLPGNKYDSWSGTSMATPHVAGAAALVEAQHSGATYTGTKALLYSAVDPLASLDGKTVTGGRLDVFEPVACSNKPKVWFEAPAGGFSASLSEAVNVKFIASNCAAASLTSVTASGTVGGVTSEIVLTAAGNGVYTGSYTPNTAGTVTITATASNGTSSTSKSVSGAVAENYQIADDTFSWIDATNGTNSGVTGDDQAKEVPIPFGFSFYGQSYNKVQISSNGFLVFGSGSATAYSNTDTSSAPNGMVAPFWDDLNPQQGGAIYYTTVGTEGSRSFVVEWNNIPHYNKVGDSTFQVVLKEGSNDIFYQYKDVNFGNSSYDYGASATIGVKSVDGSMNKQFSYNESVLQPYENRKSIRFSTSSSTAPAAPTGLSATAKAAGTIDLSWTASSSTVSGYNVYRDTSAGFAPSSGNKIGTATGTTYSDTTSKTDGTTYYYKVRAYDSSNVESADSNEASAKADGTAPTVTSVSPTDSAVDVSQGTTVTATFSEAMDTSTITSSTFTLVDSASSSVSGTVSYDSGTATFTPANPLAGSTTYTATVTTGVTDVVGNAMAAVKSWSFTTATPDTTAPETTIDSGPASLSKSSSATFGFSSNEPGSFECSLDASAFAACTSPKEYTGLSDGSHTFEVRAKDTAGNVDASPASWTWTIDTTPPDTTITDGPATLTNQSSASFTFSANETSTFECSLDSAAFAACTSPTSYSGLSNDSHKFEVRATDAAGNTDATPASATWTVDTVADAPTGLASSPTGPANDNSPEISGTAEAGSTVFLYFDAGCTSPATMNGISVSGSASAFASPGLTVYVDDNTTTTFHAMITDAAGNTSGCSTSYVTYVEDSTAPTITSVHVHDLDQTTQSLKGGQWTATVDIYLFDNTDNPVSGAVANYTWSDGYTGTGTCTTNDSGKCLDGGQSPTTPAMHKGGSKSVTLTVNDVTASGLAFVDAPHADPEADSNSDAWSETDATCTTCRPYIAIAKPN